MIGYVCDSESHYVQATMLPSYSYTTRLQTPENGHLVDCEEQFAEYDKRIVAYAEYDKIVD